MTVEVGSVAASIIIRHCEAVSLLQTAEAIPTSVPANIAAIISCSVNEIASVVPTGSGLLRNDGRRGAIFNFEFLIMNWSKTESVFPSKRLQLNSTFNIHNSLPVICLKQIHNSTFKILFYNSLSFIGYSSLKCYFWV